MSTQDLSRFKSKRQLKFEARLASAKQCPECLVEGIGPLPYSEFRSKSQTRKHCARHHAVIQQAKTKEARMGRFGISAEHFDRLLAEQGSACAICRKPSDRYQIDHDHSCCPAKGVSCGKCVRGILCPNCNFALGFFDDDPERLITAVAYLERSKR